MCAMPGGRGTGTAPSFWSSCPFSNRTRLLGIVNRDTRTPQLKLQAPKLPSSSSSLEWESELIWNLDPSKFETHLQLPHLAYPSLAAQRPTHVASAHLTTAVHHVVARLIQPDPSVRFPDSGAQGLTQKKEAVIGREDGEAAHLQG